MCKSTKWRSRFDSLVNSDQTIGCVQCGNTLVGDGPTAPVICMDCYEHDGIQLRDRVVCMECACEVLEPGTLVNRTTHPDGFTCADCGEVIGA